MSASFAKAVMPRVRSETDDPHQEPDWSLGWIVPLKLDLSAGHPHAMPPAPAHSAAVASDEASSTTAHD